MQLNAGVFEAGASRRQPFAEFAQAPLPDVAQNIVNPGTRLVRSISAIWIGCPIVAPTSGWKMFVHIDMVQASQANLLEIVDALRPASRFASRLNCRQQQCDQNPNDCNNDEEFDERERTPQFALPNYLPDRPQHDRLSPLLFHLV